MVALFHLGAPLNQNEQYKGTGTPKWDTAKVTQCFILNITPTKSSN